MKYLVIDTSTPVLFLSIVEEKKVLYNFCSKIGTDLSSEFMVIIKKAFKEVDLLPNDIDKVFVSYGPGSFTGIRIGLTFAKTFCFSLKKDLIPFSTLEAFASNCSENYTATLIDARRGYVFAGIYNSNLENVIKDQYIKIEDFMEKTKSFENLTFCSYDKFEGINTVNPKIDAIKIIDKHTNDIPMNPHKLKPMYLKNTEAEDKIKNDNRN